MQSSHNDPQHFPNMYPILACCSLSLQLTHIIYLMSLDFKMTTSCTCFQTKDVCVCPPAPAELSQWFSSKKEEVTRGWGDCSISTGYMHFEICILLCHFVYFEDFPIKKDEMSPCINCMWWFWILLGVS